MKICNITGCKNVSRGRELCSSHYMRKWRYGDAAVSLKRKGETHGGWKTPEYDTWKNIKARVKRPEFAKSYKSRGITVCQGIQKSFPHFLKIIGYKPHPDLTIDRIDNDGGYWCGACDECKIRKRGKNIRWLNQIYQHFNTRVRSDNTSGVRGVAWDKATNSWSVQLKFKGKSHHKRFKDKEKAIMYRKQLETKLEVFV